MMTVTHGLIPRPELFELGPRDQLSRDQLPLNQLPIDQLPTGSTPIKSTSHEINYNIIRGILKFYPRGK